MRPFVSDLFHFNNPYIFGAFFYSLFFINIPEVLVNQRRNNRARKVVKISKKISLAERIPLSLSLYIYIYIYIYMCVCGVRVIDAEDGIGQPNSNSVYMYSFHTNAPGL